MQELTEKAIEKAVEADLATGPLAGGCSTMGAIRRHTANGPQPADYSWLRFGGFTQTSGCLLPST